jgi:MT0933-like antitoxin protein
MSMVKKLAVLAAAAGAARTYAKKNPEQATKYVDQAAAFVDKQTKGKYSGQITGAAQKAKSAAGIDRPGPTTPGPVTPGPVTPDPTTP